MQGLDVLILRIARGKWERAEVGTWLADCYCQVQSGLKLGRLLHGIIDGEPTSAARNSAVFSARRAEVDVLVMVDADMDPAPGFFRRAVEFLADHRGAVVIGSPYCGAPPECNVQATIGGARIGRTEAAAMQGIRLVGCIGTGLIACNLAAFDAMEGPCFDYSYATPGREQVSETEDFQFTRRLTAAGGRVYADFDSWSGHAKESIIGKPN